MIKAKQQLSESNISREELDILGINGQNPKKGLCRSNTHLSPVTSHKGPVEMLYDHLRSNITLLIFLWHCTISTARRLVICDLICANRRRRRQLSSMCTRLELELPPFAQSRPRQCWFSALIQRCLVKLPCIVWYCVVLHGNVECWLSVYR